jgi:hypothetical protein
MSIIIGGIQSGQSSVQVRAEQVKSIESVGPVDILDAYQQIGGTCYAFAMAGLLRYLARIYPQDAPAQWVTPSPYWIHYHALLLDHKGEIDNIIKKHEGSWVRSAMGALVYYGCASSVGGDQYQFARRPRPNGSNIMSARSGMIYDLRPVQVFSAESAPQPFIFSAPVYDEVYQSGEITLTGSGKFLGLHAMVWLYQRDDGLHVLQNSWGSAWGGIGDGICYATSQYMSKMFDCWSWSK